MLDTTQTERHTLSILWIMSRAFWLVLWGCFLGGGYNIESLTVSEVDEQRHTSRISVVTSGTPMVIEQINKLLARLVPVHVVEDLTTGPSHVERELALVKIVNNGSQRVEALRVADSFRARTLDSTLNSFVFEVTGNSSDICLYQIDGISGQGRDCANRRMRYDQR